MRIQIIRNIIIFLFGLIVLNLFYLQVIRGGYFHNLSQSNSLRVVPFEGERGDILDCNGKVIADSQKAYHAVIVPQDLGRKTEVFGFLAKVLDQPAEELRERYLRNKLTPFSPVSVAEGISRSQAIVIQENAFRFPGRMVLEYYRRENPYAEAGAHVIGYVGKPDPDRVRKITEYGYSAEEMIGYSGIEEFYNDLLRGNAGGREIEVNSLGQQMRVLSVSEPSKGSDVQLTIDMRIQKAAYNALDGRRGAAVVLDPDTGEILALVSSPAFDPNAFLDRDDRSRVAGYLQNADSPLLNRASSAAFPPGSVFKIPVSFGGLEERKIKLTTTFDCPGYFALGARVFRSPHTWGVQDMTEAMGHSANEYFFHIGLMLGPEKISRYARLMGLGEKTGVDLPYETRGRIPSLSSRLRWFKGDTANMSIGQGDVLATPLQLVRMIAVFANNGYLVRPHLLKAVAGQEICGDTSVAGRVGLFGSKAKDFQCLRSVTHISFRNDVWQAMRRILYAPVKMESGTAHVLDMPGFDTFGKTGTAQAGSGHMDHAWFTGVTITAKRRIAYAVLLENGGGSANACAVVKQMLLDMKEKDIL
ncbi:MAG: penicillin-binding protein 2 [Candidatus Omnitrophica bacterium]|nr:penicillin-binding protein 2 [Candidatus Omnitrophota bacterium]